MNKPLRDHAQITSTKVVAFGLGNPSVSVPCNGDRTNIGHSNGCCLLASELVRDVRRRRPGSLAHVTHGILAPVCRIFISLQIKL